MMKSSAKKIELTSVDDLFGIGEQIVNIERSSLHPFPNHPFKVQDDERMTEIVESIKQYGVLVPIVVRPDGKEGYEIIAGHRRCRGCELAGLSKIPAIVKNYDDDEAIIVMVDSNLQREIILPSERAFAFKLKLEAIKRQGTRSDLTSVQVEQKLNAREVVAKEAGASAVQIQRFIRLTVLIPELLDRVDNKKIAFNPAVELSYLAKKEQTELLKIMDELESTPSLSQAQRMKKFSQESKLSVNVMEAILSEEKKPEKEKIVFEANTMKKYFPRAYTPKQIQDKIISILDNWMATEKKRQQNRER